MTSDEATALLFNLLPTARRVEHLTLDATGGVWMATVCGLNGASFAATFCNDNDPALLEALHLTPAEWARTTLSTCPEQEPCFVCWDDSGERVTLQAATPEDAAGAYARSFDPSDETYWLKVRVNPTAEPDDLFVYRIAVHPLEPACSISDGHDWRDGSPVGNGSGVIYVDTCKRCGLRRTTDTCAQDPTDGVQDLTSIRFE